MVLARFSSLFVVALIAVFLASAGKTMESDLQSEIERVLAEEGLTGIAWGLVGESGLVTLGAAGLRDNPARSAFTIDTRFHVGSLTKSLVATGLLRLVTEGSVELDAPVSRYLPNLPFDNPWSGQSDVTVRHLLDHTSGLEDARLWQLFSERPAPDTPLVDAFPEPTALLRIRSRPGSRFSYSNMGYTLLGLIVEAVTETRYETYLDKHILAPLAMRDSTFAFTTQETKNADSTLAWGHVDDGSRYAASPIYLRPAGQFTATAGDLVRFAQFLLSDGVVDGQAFIHESLMGSRGHTTGTEAANSGLEAGYALGLGRRDRHGVVGYCHGGNIVGFVAMLCVFPDEQKAFAYSVNTDSESANYGRIDKLLIDALALAGASSPPTVEPTRDVVEWHGRYVLSPNRFRTFEYLDTVFGAIKVSGDASTLQMTSLQSKPRQLRSVGSRIFSAADRTTSSHVFLRGEKGEYLISDGFNTFEKVPSTYLVAHWASIFLGLLGITWLFVSGLVSLARYRARVFWQPVAPAFFALLLLLVPVPLFMTQSFMALGDLTPASVALAIVTLALPLGMLLTLWRVKKGRSQSRLSLVHGLAAFFVLHWCVVLTASGMLPLRLWI